MSPLPSPLLQVRVSPPPVVLRCWPLWQRGWQSVGVPLGLLTAGLIAWWVTRDSSAVLVVVVLLALACWRYFVPTTFELSAMGVTIQTFGYRRRVTWGAIDRVRLGQHGCTLEADAALLAPLRQIYLPWLDHEAAVLAQIEYHLPATAIERLIELRPSPAANP